MRIGIDNFRGEIPRMASQLLPAGHATTTQQPRLLSGNLESWADWNIPTSLSKQNINSIYLLEDTYWLSWAQTELQNGASQIDVARSNLASDQNGRIFFTGTDLPRYTTVALATTSQPYPAASKPLGVVAPINAPVATPGGVGGLNSPGKISTGFYSQDIVLMQMVGTTQAQLLVDNDGHTFTATGTVNVITPGPFSGTNQNALGAIGNGTISYISTPDAPEFAFGTGDFTLEGEFQVNISAETQDILLFSKSNSPATVNGPWRIGIQATTGLPYMQFSSAAGAPSVFDFQSFGNGGAFPTTGWHHVAMVAFNGNFTLYIDGIGVATGTSTNSALVVTDAVRVGFDPGTSSCTLDYSNIRISNYAVYTANFTPPSALLTATKLVTLSASGATLDSTGGNPGYTLDLQSTAGTTTMSYGYIPNCPINGGNYLTVDYDFNLVTETTDANISFDTYLAENSAGQTARIRLTKVNGTWVLAPVTVNNFSDQGALGAGIALGANPPTGTWLHMSITMTQTVSGSWTANCNITNGGAQVGTANIAIPVSGPANYFGWGTVQPIVGKGNTKVLVDNFKFTSNLGAPPINVVDGFDGGNNNGWTFINNQGIIGGGVHGGNQNLTVAIQSTGGNPGGCLNIAAINTFQFDWAKRFVGVDQSQSIQIQFDFNATGTGSGANSNKSFYVYFGLVDDSGKGGIASVGQDYNSPANGLLHATMFASTSLSQAPQSTQSENFTSGPLLADGAHWYTVKMNINRGSTSATVNITIQAANGTGPTYSFSFTEPAFNNAAGNFVFGMNSPYDPNFYAWSSLFDNVKINGSLPPQQNTTTQEATSYVYTFVNSLGEESAPSPASATILRSDGIVVTVVTDTNTANTTLYDVQNKNIYRAVTANGTTAFQFIATIPLAQSTYFDSLIDSQLGGVLPSLTWDLPPSNMRGILALPNGLYVGYSNNQLCISEKNKPHAWVVANRISFDKKVVAIGAIDTSVVIFTEGYPYFAMGTTSSNYAAGKIEIPQGAVGVRSSAYIKGIGVLCATQDGLIAVSGPGRGDVVTAQLFTKKEWSALNPSSIIAIAYDDRYFGFYDATSIGGSKGGFYIEFGQGGAGKVSMTFHATAVHTQLKGDNFFAVLDVATEATF